MNEENEKCVMIIDEQLPLGVICNTAAVLGITIGKMMPEIVGSEVYDKTKQAHLGVIKFPVPILKGSTSILSELRAKLYTTPFEDIITVDFSSLAQGCKTYDEYIEKMKDTKDEELSYIGIAICGNKKKINKLTGSLPLLR